ncbi:TIGR01212 family radical SAM protein [Gudongella sp. SC589]|uniref:TIGR01212 family radical SAM protein n=1 Tax=Gudongella sp. SC589 TaxID=3385990 RepID=UPI003904C015
MNEGKRYNNLSGYLRETFGGKVAKLSIDGGFTCPNRDGHKGDRGCIFCGEMGAGEFASRLGPVQDQVDEQIRLLGNKWKTDKYIAYFQSFTNTYAPVERLKEVFEPVLGHPKIVGIAIATRPDCLPEEVLDYLSQLNERTFVWIELGLQTIHEETAKLIRRGYPLETYEKAVEQLKERGIRTVTHLIVGLPHESREMILESARYVGETDTWGIKLHSLYIQRDTDLYTMFLERPFPLMTLKEYVETISEIISILPKEMVVHRITGDGDKSLLHEPKWSRDKLKVIASIDKRLKEMNILQGCAL